MYMNAFNTERFCFSLPEHVDPESKGLLLVEGKMSDNTKSSVSHR